MKTYKFFIALVCLLAAFAFVATIHASAMTLRVATLDGEEGGTVQVPLQVSGATNLGALQFDVRYDPQVLQIANVTRGALAGNGLVDSNASESGKLRIGVVTTDALNGDGVIANANFKIIGRAGTNSALTIENARAWETPSHLEILVNVEAGRVNVIAASPPWLIIGAVIALLLLALFILIFALTRRRKPAPAYAPATFATAPFVPPANLPERRAAANWKCTRCGTVNSVTNHFCGNCGAAR